VADIFVSYTGSDRDWAFWIGHELTALGHTPRIHEWEIGAGGDIMTWMDERLEAADHVLCVVSEKYLEAPYSSWERRSAQWAAVDRPNLALPVFVEPCKAPPLFATLKRCDLYDLVEEEARARLSAFLAPAGKPPPRPFPGRKMPFPGGKKSSADPTPAPPPPLPGKPAIKLALSNVPISVPLHFVGRDDALADIDTAFARGDDRVAITALHGLRGVGKTVLAAAYAERHRADYRATWWIRAQSEPSMRADLVALGIRLGWVGADDKEEPALAAVMERLRHEGEGILLVFDNANDADEVKPYLPRSGAARVLITSTAHAWRSVARPVEIRLWPKETGADYLITCTGRHNESTAAQALSAALGGLPLAHAQAAAYCERLGISFSEYRKRFDAAPARLLDDTRHAPAEYHDGLTVAKTFALAIEEAARLNPAAEPLIAQAALLAPDPIPLFLFDEARESFGEPLATALAGGGLDEVVAALRTFALVDREAIVDERDPTITTDAIRLHRLVREIAAARREGAARGDMRRTLMAALEAVYPNDAYENPALWQRCAPLTPHLLASCQSEPDDGAASAQCANLLVTAANYLHGRAAYAAARPAYERALAIQERVLGPEHPYTASSLNNLASLLQDTNRHSEAEPLYRRSLAIGEKHCPDHPEVARWLNNLASLLQDTNRLSEAEQLFRRAQAIEEKSRGPDHPKVAICLNNLATLLQSTKRLSEAEPLFRRALAIFEASYGPDHPYVATGLINVANLLRVTNRLSEAEPLFRHALAIDKRSYGPEHPNVARDLNNLAFLLRDTSQLSEAEPLLRRALAISEKCYGPDHRNVALRLNNLAGFLKDSNRPSEAEPLFRRALSIFERSLGPDHSSTLIVRNNLSALRPKKRKWWPWR
jgi:tetratricopeptide (TPR) repeat protein